jgi:hypothetical protein
LKKLTVYFTLLIFAMNIAGWQLLFSFILDQYHQHTWNQATGSISEFSKHEKHLQVLNSHEVLVDGKLYDIVRTTGSKIYCVADASEDEMMKSYDDVVKTNSSGSHSKLLKVDKTLTLDYINTTAIEFVDCSSIADPAPCFSPDESGAFHSILSPPPETVN